uniref:DUF305 domain-containing protein n=1 Tax=Nocardioides sp. TaxID=35761 RepID=UPI00356274D3
GPEIEQMTTWLTEWDQPIPETARDHSNSHDGMGMGMDSDMPGMMSDDDLDGLEMTMGSGFESMWLTMMIEHHEGAIEMAETELADGVHPGSLALAQDIIDGQTAEIATMKAMLG